MSELRSCESEELDAPYILSEDQRKSYREYGYLKLRQILSPQLLQKYRSEIGRKVEELNTQSLPMEKRSTYDKAFLQIMNLWTKSEIVREFVFGKRLARI